MLKNSGVFKGRVIENEVRKLSRKQIIKYLVDHCEITLVFTMIETGSCQRVLSKYVTRSLCVLCEEKGKRTGNKGKEIK